MPVYRCVVALLLTASIASCQPLLAENGTSTKPDEHRHSFAIVSLFHHPHHKPVVARLYAVAARNHLRYGAKHNYTVFNSWRRWFDDPSVHPAWDKIKAWIHALEFMHHYTATVDTDTRTHMGWLWALDGDAVINNMNITLKSVVTKYATNDTMILAGHDCNGLNSGSLLLRVHPWTLQFLRDMDSWRTAYVDDKAALHPEWIWDNAAFWWLQAHRTDVQKHTTVIPMDTFNSYPAESGCGGKFKMGDADLAVHFAGPGKNSPTLDGYVEFFEKANPV